MQQDLGEFSSQNFTHFASKRRLLKRLLEKRWRQTQACQRCKVQILLREYLLHYKRGKHVLFCLEFNFVIMLNRSRGKPAEGQFMK